MTDNTIQVDAPTDADAALQPDFVEVTQHVPLPVNQVWSRLIAREGVEAFLGEGATLGTKGDPWHAADGTRGVTRSYHPEEQVRVSWHADEDAPATVVDLQMAPEAEGTKLTLRHEHLPADLSADDRAGLQQRWTDALGRLVQI